MIGDALVDEVHLYVFPFDAGNRPRVFADDTQTKWSLANNES